MLRYLTSLCPAGLLDKIKDLTGLYGGFKELIPNKALKTVSGT